jgi:hypothetical protein
MNFKIIFPAGYSVTDPDNDNIDINIVLENRKVFLLQYLLWKMSDIY